MLGRSELAVLSSRSQLAQHVLVQITLHIQVLDIMFIQFIETCDHLLQYLRGRNQKHGILHVAREGRRVRSIHGFDKRKHLRADNIIDDTGIFGFEFTPAQFLSLFVLRENLRHLFTA
ncbi:hypothetical protein D3C75_1104210 [compost metagenome]